MKVTITSVLIAILVLLSSCSGSDTYRGDWKAVDAEGNKYQFHFKADSYTIENAEGTMEKFEYSQNQINTTNSVETYGIKTSKGKKFSIHFPIADDESVGSILDGQNNILFLIGRDHYPTYKEIYGM